MQPEYNFFHVALLFMMWMFTSELIALGVII